MRGENKNARVTLAAVVVAGLLASCAAEQLGGAGKAQTLEPIFETNVTHDISVSSGEPEITIDPSNPRNLAVIEFGVGSDKAPAYVSNPFMVRVPGAMANDGRVLLSHDGGDTWAPAPLPVPVFDSDFLFGSDPAIAFGPRGALYAVSVLAPKKPMKTALDVSGFRIGIAASPDGGKTWDKTRIVQTAPHRPWLKVDQSTGTVYLSALGFPPDADTTNDALNDGWIVTWKPLLSAGGEPRKSSGPGYVTSAGRHMTVANGVVATVFLIGPPIPESPNKQVTGPMPVPAGLQSAVKDGTTSCSAELPCLFFQTSSDEGRTWTVRQVPLPASGYSGIYPIVAADPGRKGRYAISFTTKKGGRQTVVVTEDAGKTWSAPVTVPETLPGADFKGWMDYGPTGVLGIMWKKQIDIVPGGEHGAPGFDVYAAISCDGGRTWLAPVRVNAETSPSGPNGNDDMSYIALDAHYAHLVWGDRRNIVKIKNAPGAPGGLQTYYGRVPLATVANGAKCGR